MICRYRNLAVLLFVFCAACSHSPPGQAQSTQEWTTVYVVRHAEKEKVGKDPALNAAGQQRALLLSQLLSEVPISAVFSSDYKRTRDTLAPLAKTKNLKTIIYDARNSAELVERVLQEHSGEQLVIAGHSNTVPDLVQRLLAADSGLELKPAKDLDHEEYDKLFIVVRGSHGESTVLTLKYGAASTH